MVLSDPEVRPIAEGATGNRRTFPNLPTPTYLLFICSCVSVHNSKNTVSFAIHLRYLTFCFSGLCAAFPFLLDPPLSPYAGIVSSNNRHQSTPNVAFDHYIRWTIITHLMTPLHRCLVIRISAMRTTHRFSSLPKDAKPTPLQRSQFYPERSYSTSSKTSHPATFWTAD